MIFCCEDMKIHIKDKRCKIYYDNLFREFYFKIDRLHILKLLYCPWCGTKLPKQLRDEFFDILENEYDIETDIFEYKVDLRIPQEFKTDEWWQKREL